MAITNGESRTSPDVAAEDESGPVCLLEADISDETLFTSA